MISELWIKIKIEQQYMINFMIQNVFTLILYRLLLNLINIL